MWREALVVALRTLHPKKCLVYLIGMPSRRQLPAVVYTVTNAMLYDAVNDIHFGQCLTLFSTQSTSQP
jgi:hypothetical protein